MSAALRAAGWRTIDGYWWGGHAVAMTEVASMIADMTSAGHDPEVIVAAVFLFARGVARLQEHDEVPASWLQAGPDG